MPFLIIGVLCLVLGIFFYRQAKKSHDEEGLVGTSAMIAVGIILIVLYGIFYREFALLP